MCSSILSESPQLPVQGKGRKQPGLSTFSYVKWRCLTAQLSRGLNNEVALTKDYIKVWCLQSFALRPQHAKPLLATKGRPSPASTKKKASWVPSAAEGPRVPNFLQGLFWGGQSILAICTSSYAESDIGMQDWVSVSKFYLYRNAAFYINRAPGLCYDPAWLKMMCSLSTFVPKAISK